MRAQATLDIQAAIETVFAAITDPKRGPEWNPNILEVSTIQGYPAAAGSSWEQQTVMAGRPLRLRCRIRSFSPPHHGVLEVSGPQSGTVTTTCEVVAGRTRVTQVLEFQPPGGRLGEMAANLMRPALERELLQTLERQRHVLEKQEGGRRGSTA